MSTLSPGPAGHDQLMTGSYDPRFVILSLVIASLASYAALDLAGRVRSAEGSTRYGWLVGGASVMGLGIWSMNFVGMLAFRLPIPITYDLPRMLLSVGVAIAASLLALIVVSREELHLFALVSGGGLMGVAIAGMHYTGMAGVRFAPLRLAAPHEGYVLATNALAVAVVLGALVILALALIGAVIDRNIQSRITFAHELACQVEASQRLAAQLETANAELRRMFDDAVRARRDLAEEHAAYAELQAIAQEQAAKARWLEGVAEATTALAHEVNNPLTSLLMNVEFLDESDADDAAESIAAIQAAARRIAAVVNRLSNVANPRSVGYLGESRMLDLSPEAPG